MARVVFSAAALEDLERIVEFLVEAASPDSAVAAIDHIRTAVAILATHPRIGRRTRGTMRELVVSHGTAGYLALYRVSAGGVVRILRIRHQRQAGYRD
jgi:plasmid stabilization system protein ParE